MKVKGIMFSGFAAAILMGAVDASAATAFNIASQAYVDQEIGKLSGTNGAITNLQNAVQTLNGSDTTTGSVAKAVKDAVDTEVTRADGKYQTLENKATSLDGTFADDTQYPSAKAVKAAIDGVSSGSSEAVQGLADKVAATNESLQPAFAAGTTVYGALNGLEARMDTAESEIDALQASVDTTTTGLKDRVSAIENSDAYKSGIDSAKVAQIATNTSAISTINGDASTTGSIAKAVKDAVDTEVARADGKYQTLSNKVSNLTNADDTHYPSALAVKTAIDGVSSGSSAAVQGLADKVAATNESLQPAFAEGTTVYGALNGLEGRMDAVETGVSTNADAIDAINDATNGIAAKAATDATTKAGQALTDAKAYTDALANGAVKANTDAIAALNNTYATDAEVNAKFGGGNGINALPAYSTCTGESGKCVLSIDKTTGALEWVEVTPPLTSNN